MLKQATVRGQPVLVPDPREKGNAVCRTVAEIPRNKEEVGYCTH